MIIPGIFEETLEEYKEKIEAVDEMCELIQIDIADGIKVNGKTYQDIEKIIRIDHKTPLDIHLMVENPLSFIPIEAVYNNNVNSICTQVVPFLDKVISNLKGTNCKIGVSINADEKIDLLYPYIDCLDYIQFMSVTPGKQGNSFIPEVLEKIKNFKKGYPHLKTQIDGGVTDATFSQIIESGVDNIVIGSAIFNSEDPIRKLSEFQIKFANIKSAQNG